MYCHSYYGLGKLAGIKIKKVEDKQVQTEFIETLDEISIVESVIDDYFSDDINGGINGSI